MTDASEDKSRQSFSRAVPAGDTHSRAVCDACGFIDYENPRVVVGAVVETEGRILLCRRAIEPRRGFWTLPAGFLEKHERPEIGAAREAFEEANARIAIRDLLAVYAIPHLSQIQLIYRAGLASPGYAAGEESLEVALFDWPDIPWEEIAFPSVHWALGHYREAGAAASIVPFTNPDDADGILTHE